MGTAEVAVHPDTARCDGCSKVLKEVTNATASERKVRRAVAGARRSYCYPTCSHVEGVAPIAWKPLLVRNAAKTMLAQVVVKRGERGNPLIKGFVVDRQVDTANMSEVSPKTP